MQAGAELLSLGLTITLVVLVVYVLYLWTGSAFAAVKDKNRDGAQWLIMGVAISFYGTLCDNCYWFVPWTLKYLGWESYKTIFIYGAFANIPFRQVSGIVAAYCHIRSAQQYGVHRARGLLFLERLCIASAVAGFLYMATLILLRTYTT